MNFDYEKKNLQKPFITCNWLWNTCFKTHTRGGMYFYFFLKCVNTAQRTCGKRKHFQLPESGSVSAIRAWMISQAGPPYPQLQWESHCYCVPQPLITFSNDSAKQQGIPTACHQPAPKCACGGWRGGEGVKTASRNRTAAILGSSCPVALRVAAIRRSNTFRSSLKWSADTEGP